ncbi:GGDEF domain-containing protein [Brucella intermedia]|nr:GGDEF domain-containing protein [Brucella intermedia]
MDLSGLPAEGWVFARAIKLRLETHGVGCRDCSADIDYLKRINDQYGHPSGDDAVISAAHALEDCLPSDSLIARIGGDEFCAFVPKASIGNIEAAVSDTAAKALGLFREKRPDIKHQLSISVGQIACKPGQTFEEVMALADKGLYRKKSSRSQERI